MKCKSCGLYVNDRLTRCNNCAFPVKRIVYQDDDYYKIIENKRIDTKLEQIYKTETFKRRGVGKGA